MKSKPLKRSDVGLIAKKRINPQSRKKKREIAETAQVRQQYREEHPYCEIGIIIAYSSGTAPWCALYTQGIHERKKRSHQGSLIDPVNLMASCNACNSWVECNPVKARELGFVVYSHEEPADIFVYRGPK